MRSALINAVVVVAVSAAAFAHPGIGVVVDKAGNVYYTDLKQVWRMDARGAKTIVVPNVHTHELYLDAAGNLFGEHLWYTGPQDGSGTYHFRIWKRSPDGRITDVVPATAGFRKDESFVRDAAGNAYVAGESSGESKRKVVRRISPAGRSTRLAAGFTNIRWMAIGADQNLYLVDDNHLCRVHTDGKDNDGKGNDGKVTVLSRNLGDASANPLSWSSDHQLMGIAADALGNVYVANYSAAKVKKVGRDGQVTIFDRSSGKWSPTGIALSGDKAYILESDGLYGVRVRTVALTQTKP